MVERYLTKEQSDALFAAGASSVLQKKAQAAAAAAGAAKGLGLLGVLKMIKDGTLGFVSSGHSALKTGITDAGEALNLLAKLAIGGAGLGIAGGVGYNLAKTRMSQNSPEEEMNRKIEAMYKNKSRELADAKWMDKVRSMRDELKRGYKKMTTEEYTKKYIALMDALNERSE